MKWKPSESLSRQLPAPKNIPYQSVHKYVDIQAAYLRDGLWKKDRIFSGLRCKESIDDFTLLLKSSRLGIEVRPPVSASDASTPVRRGFCLANRVGDKTAAACRRDQRQMPWSSSQHGQDRGQRSEKSGSWTPP